MTTREAGHLATRARDLTTARARRSGAVLARQARTALPEIPARLRRLFESQYWREFRYKVVPPDRGQWTEPAIGIALRQYRTYDDYVEHQRSKLELMDLTDYDAAYFEALRDRLVRCGEHLRGKSVLCLAARIGTEVKTFIDLGSFAVGVDLNPGPDNPWVLVGDFHSLQFADGCVDIVFTNSLDHALEPETLAAEMERVLKPDGIVIIELAGESVGGSDAQWEAFVWTDHNLVLELFAKRGFTERCRAKVELPAAHDLFVVLGRVPLNLPGNGSDSSL